MVVAMAHLNRIFDESPFLAICRGLKNPEDFVFGEKKLRPLTNTEIGLLVSQNNYAQDWSNIRVVEDFLTQRIVGCHFLGLCRLGRFADDAGTHPDNEIPSGLYNSTLLDVVVGDGALIHRCELVSHYIIDQRSAVCGSWLSGKNLSNNRPRGDGGTPFGNGVWINAGIETGGRAVPLYVDLDSFVSEKSARSTDAGDYRRELERFLAVYTGTVTLPMGYLGKKSRIRGALSIKDSFIGPDVLVEGAARIADCSIIGNEKSPVFIGAGCILDGAILRPGSHLDSQAIVSRSFIAETARVGKQAKVNESYIGPNSVIEEGEVTACFVGPFVAAHHQSLLIAAFWPRGRGNVSSGANVGSNHSSRSPDGEIWPGEGMFFGLGCNIKYPADYSSSPYTIIATGVTTLPQKLEFPFSLILQPDEPQVGVSPAFNRLIPAWVLSDNLYAVRRNEVKFATRNRVPDTVFDSDPFGPETLEGMKKAAAALEGVKVSKSIYLPGDIPGMGKNFLLEKDRLRSIEIYDFFIRLAELKAILASGHDLRRRIPHDESLHEVVQEYSVMLEKCFVMIRDSRLKDHSRGAKIIPDYRETHRPPDEDAIIQETRKAFDREIHRVRKETGLA